MHQRALQRETLLKQRVAELEAQLRLREQQLFGTKTETHTTTPSTNQPPIPKKPRGQQPGKPGPKRRDHSHLPAVEEVLDLPAEQRTCSCCGLPLESFPGTEEGAILEIDVKAYRRVYRRRRYRPTCGCPINPGILTAPPPDKLIPKSLLGTSIWVEVLLDKYLFYRPTYRLLADWKTHGLDLSLGTLTDGLHRLLPLFEPIYQELTAHNQSQQHWHADETRWLVFATVEGKVSQRWWLWVFHSHEAVVFVLDQGRARDVPETHLGPVEEGILSVDRYSAYKAMESVKDGSIVLAFCWAHVRRDFLAVARSWSSEEAWAMGWIERIGLLYQANDARLEAQGHAAAFAQKDARLRQQVEAMKAQAETELSAGSIHPARQKVLSSLQEHWSGLTVFVDNPSVPLDNNTAERVQRGPVVLRKNSYGSGSVWSGELAAVLFSVFQTLCLWDVNPRVWLEAYLQECAQAGGQAPADVGEYLPWKMSEAKRQGWSLEKAKPNEDST